MACDPRLFEQPEERELYSAVVECYTAVYGEEAVKLCLRLGQDLSVLPRLDQRDWAAR